MGFVSPELIPLHDTEQIIGYLNYSSGIEDSGFTSNLEKLFRDVECEAGGQPTTAGAVYH